MNILYQNPMSFYMKIALLFMLCCVINPALMISYIGILNLPGGEVGMLPLVVFILNLSAIPITLIVTMILRVRYSIDILNTIWIYNLVFLLLAMYPFYFRHGVKSISTVIAVIVCLILSSGIVIAARIVLQELGRVFTNRSEKM